MKPLVWHLTILLFFSVLTSPAQVAEGILIYKGEREIQLNGEWEFYWDTLFTEQSDRKAKPAYITLPALWNDEQTKGELLPAFGTATFRITIKPDQAYDDLAIRIFKVYSSYRLILNGEEIGRSGIVACSREEYVAGGYPQTISLELEEDENELILQISNFDHRKGGNSNEIILGDRDFLFSQRDSQMLTDSFAIGSMFIIGCFFLGMFLFWRREPEILFFALFAIFFSVMVGRWGLLLLNQVFPSLTWLQGTRVEYVSIFCCTTAFVLFFDRMFWDKYSKIAIAYAVFSLLQVLLVLFAPAMIFTYTMNVHPLVAFPYSLFILYALIKAVIAKRQESLIVFFGFVSILAGYAINYLVYFHFIPAIPLFPQVVNVFAFLVFSFALAQRFARSYRMVETLQMEAQDQKEVIELKNRTIQESLEEKESLLKEIHHRVKNNLQVISSLLNMQSRESTDEKMQEVIQEGQSRVKAMSLIHQKLYQTENISEIDFQDYIQNLVEQLARVYKRNDLQVTNEISANDIKLDIDTAIPVGLILNELVSNAYKYAFEEADKGKIRIELDRIDDGKLRLDVEDNGKGIPRDINFDKVKSLGLKLVNILTKQLRGSISYRVENGTRFSIIFSDLKMTTQL